ncbi:hypothetical protein [Micromonospora sonneratiae]|uniref:DUF3396 domain-containing protein n=1 Tax=Micromonospora sonneratiae TaxID=1184706 RepID=A0ABW3YB08_9ACTN
MSDYYFGDGGPVAEWAPSGGPKPDFATCLLYLDRGDDLEHIAPLLQLWYDEASRLLLPFVQPLGAPEPTRSLSAYEENAEGRGRRRRPGTWAEGLTEDLFQLSAHWFDVTPSSIASELDLYVFRFAQRRHVKLQVSIGFQDRPDRLPLVLPALVELTRSVADVADPSYGEIVVNAETVSPATMLDSALYRPNEESARTSRTRLRGYEWVTVCPKELTPVVGGVSALRAGGAFSEVLPLAHGGALLRATESPADYRADRVRAVFRALAPVLPSGQPCDLPGHDLSRVVFADARNPTPNLDLGPGLAPGAGPRRSPLDPLDLGLV